MTSSSLINNITKENLSHFHAVHFPGQPTPSIKELAFTGFVASTSTLLSQDAKEGDEEQEEDLGLYPDGVKRTLTDQQVAIFRHSEVHRLREERRSKQAMKEVEMESNIAITQGIKETSSRKLDDTKSLPSSTFTRKAGVERVGELLRPLALTEPLVFTNAILDYGGRENGSDDARDSATISGKQHTQRKHIHYDDECEPSDAFVRSSSTKANPKAFLWPKLG